MHYTMIPCPLGFSVSKVSLSHGQDAILSYSDTITVIYYKIVGKARP